MLDTKSVMKKCDDASIASATKRKKHKAQNDLIQSYFLTRF